LLSSDHGLFDSRELQELSCDLLTVCFSPLQALKNQRQEEELEQAAARAPPQGRVQEAAESRPA
jgi:hypothetical protein